MIAANYAGKSTEQTGEYYKDNDGRTVADVVLSDGTNVNRSLVKDGWCWWYRKYVPGDTVLEKLEAEARAARHGLWGS